MNKQIKHVAIAALLMFAALLVNSNIVQVGEASSLRANPHNVRVLYGEYSHKRGPIDVAGTDVARSVKTSDALKYQRTYPGGAEYAPVTGYYSLVIGASGIEQAEDPVLAGTSNKLFFKRFSDEITGRTPQGGSVVLTLNPKAQAAAYNGLKGVRGAVVALNPTTGAILAMATSPSYNPSTLSTHDSSQINSTYHRLLKDPGNPLINRALNETYPPGSLFKIVTSSAAFSSGKFTPSSVIGSPSQLKLPLTTTYLHNFGGESCGNGTTDTISDAFRISCNTAFANLGLKVGINAMSAQAKAFGIGSSLSIPLPVSDSQYAGDANRPNLALSAIGQYDDALTPLQAAMIGGAIADRGIEMKPYLVAQELAPDASVLSQAKPQVLRRSVTPEVAKQVTAMMELVVKSGTGTSAQIPGITVAGKTGTAQHGTSTEHLAPHAWFVAFAPAEHPTIAVAVLVEDGGSLGSEATGGAGRGTHREVGNVRGSELPVTSDSGSLQTVGDRYVLDRTLSSSDDQQVWLAHDDVVGRPVVLTVFRGPYAVDSTWRAAFRRRGDQLVAMSHPGIAKLYEHGGSDDDAWVATAYVRDATPLTDLSALTTAAALDIIGQTAMALDAAHTAGIAHGALTTGHVLLRDRTVVSLTGFAPVTTLTELDDLTSLRTLARDLLAGATPPADSSVVTAFIAGLVAPVAKRPQPAGDLGRTALALAASLATPAATTSAPPTVTAPDESEAAAVEPAYDVAERKRVRNKLIAVAAIVVIGGAALLWLIGRGAGEATVPSVVNLPLSQAQNELVQDGFRGETSTGNGTVTSQSPPAGSQAKQGSVVTLTVTGGDQ